MPRASGCFYSTGAATQKGCEAHETRLKQAGRVWYETISKTLQKKLGFQQLHSDAGVHILHQREGDHEIILILYVDDLLIMGNSQPMIHSIKKQLMAAYQMKDLGAATSYLGIRIIWEQVEDQRVTICHIPGEDNPADLFTKQLG